MNGPDPAVTATRYTPTTADLVDARAFINDAVADYGPDHVMNVIFGAVQSSLNHAAGCHSDDIAYGHVTHARALYLVFEQWDDERRKGDAISRPEMKP